MFPTLLRFSGSNVCRGISLQSVNTRCLSSFDQFLRRTNRSCLLVDNEKHELLYKYNYVLHTSALYRSKVFCPVASLALSPLLHLIDKEVNFVMYTAATSILYFITVYCVSKVFGNLVGYIFVNKSDNLSEVIISSLQSSGSRIDRVHKSQDLVVIGSDNMLYKILGLVTLKDTSGGVKYFMSTRKCTIKDTKIFESIIGDFSAHI